MEFVIPLKTRSPTFMLPLTFRTGEEAQDSGVSYAAGGDLKGRCCHAGSGGVAAQP